MQYNELTDHLFNLKVLATLDFQKVGITEYLQSIKESRMLETEAKLRGQETNLGHRQIQQVIDKSGEVSFDTFYDETTTKITNLLKDIEIEEPLFGGINIKLKNILETIKKSKDLREFIFGYPVIFQSGNFGKEPFNKQFKDIKTESEVLSYYTELNNFQLESNFISYLKLLERTKTPLRTAVDSLKKELEKTLKNKNQEEKRTHIRALNNHNKTKIEQSPFLVVSDVINYDYNSDIDLAKFLYTFTKSNSIETNKLIDLKSYLITLFFDANIKIKHSSLIENIQLEKDEFLGLFEKRVKLSKLLLPSYIELFRDIEKQLIDEGYFDNSAKWKKGTNKKLVEFIMHCHKSGYFKIRATTTDNKELSKIRRFFQARYSISIEKQFQPKQREKIEMPSSTFQWIKEAY